MTSDVAYLGLHALPDSVRITISVADGHMLQQVKEVEHGQAGGIYAHRAVSCHCDHCAAAGAPDAITQTGTGTGQSLGVPVKSASVELGFFDV